MQHQAYNLEKFITENAALGIKKSMRKKFVVKLFLIALCLMVLSTFTFKAMVSLKLETTSTLAVTELNSIDSLMQNNLVFLQNQARQLVANSELLRFIITRELASKEFIESGWQKLATNLEKFKSITYFDFLGEQEFQINYDKENFVASVSEEFNQISDQFYFQHSINLLEEQVYTSTIHLLTQYQELVYPLQPMIRIASPVYTGESAPDGIVVLNVFADDFLSIIDTVTSHSAGNTYLINNEGFYVVNPIAEQQWGQSVSDRKSFNFSKIYQEIWLKFQQQQSGKLKTSDGYFIFHKLNIDQSLANSRNYFLVTHVTTDDIASEMGPLKDQLTFFAILLLILSVFGLVQYQKNRQKEVIHQQAVEIISALFNSKQAIFIMDKATRIIAINQAFSELTELKAEQIVNKTLAELLSHYHQKIDQDALWNSLQQSQQWREEISKTRSDNSIQSELLIISPVQSTSSQPDNFIGNLINISDQKHLEAELRLAAVALETSSGVAITDQNGVIVRVNTAFTKITGYSAIDAIGNNPSMLSSGQHDQEFFTKMWGEIHQNGFWQGEIWNRQKNGTVYPEWLTITRIKGQGKQTYFVASFVDITERKAIEQQLEALATTDTLTNCHNRRKFEEYYQIFSTNSERYSHSFSLILLDIDFFKKVNDNFGHNVGDQVLVKVAAQLKNSLRECDVVARWGGEEFIVLLPDTEIDAATHTSERLRKDIESLSLITPITCSFGVTQYITSDQLTDTVTRADNALYQAKESGRNRVCVDYIAAENCH